MILFTPLPLYSITTLAQTLIILNLSVESLSKNIFDSISDLLLSEGKDEGNFFELMSNPMEFEKYCLLCRELIVEESVEHIFPKWYLRKMDMWNEKLVDSQKNTRLMKSIFIPCCQSCNNDNLSAIENRVKEYFNNPKIKHQKKYEVDLFYWMLKIYLGLAILSTHTKQDIKKPNSETIYTIDHLKALRHLFMLFSGLKYSVKTINYTSYSVFSFEMDISSFRKEAFFISHPVYPSILLGYKSKAVIVFFDDDSRLQGMYKKNLAKRKNKIFKFNEIVDIYSNFLAASELYFKSKSEVFYVSAGNRTVMSSLKSSDQISKQSVIYPTNIMIRKHVYWCYKTFGLKYSPIIQEWDSNDIIS